MTAYEMRISDWSSDVCSSDLPAGAGAMFADVGGAFQNPGAAALAADLHQAERTDLAHLDAGAIVLQAVLQLLLDGPVVLGLVHEIGRASCMARVCQYV